MRATAAAFDRQLGFDRHADWNGFNASDLHTVTGALPNRLRRCRMLKSPPEEEAVDRENRKHEAEPPDAIVLQAGVALAQFCGQPGVAWIPDDSFDAFRRRRLGQEGDHDHHEHAEYPGDEGRMLIGAIGPQPLNLWKGIEDEKRREGEAEADRPEGCGGSGSPPEQAKCEDDGEWRCEEEEDALELLVQRLFGLQAEVVADGDAHYQNAGAANPAEANQFLFASLRSNELAVKIHRGECRSAVEH